MRIGLAGVGRIGALSPLRNRLMGLMLWKKPFWVGFGAVTVIQLQLDHLALAHLADTRKAELRERPHDCGALRIEHAIFEPNVNARPHRPRAAIAPSPAP